MTNYAEIARVHSVWRGMKNRCESTKNAFYGSYGGRGIYVCDEWQDFNVFCQWMLDNKSSPLTDIDRIDNNGPYSPDNCRLVSHKQNCRNKSNNLLLTAWGETKTLVEWSEDSRASVSQRMIRERVAVLHWAPERAISAPADKTRKSGNPTHCKHGHEYTESNTYYSKAAPHLKKCRRCHADRQTARYRRLYK